MKLSRIKFWVLYIPFYIFLPCAIDIKCAENDARLNIWSFDLKNELVQSYDEYKYNGIDVRHRFHCNESDFRFFLKEVVKEAKELKKKNDADIKKGVSIDERGKTFNKKVLVVNREQIKIVFEELNDILGCQECPTILFCDKNKSGENGSITNYNAFFNFYSDFLKNGKRGVGMKRINKQKMKYDESLKKIFDNDKKNFGIITGYYSNLYYSNSDYKSIIIETLFNLKNEIINDINTLDINDIKRAAEDSQLNIISENALGQEILNFKALCEKYQQAENDILNSKNTDELPDVLNSYIRWRKNLLQAQIIKTFIYFLGKSNIVKKNEDIIMNYIKQEQIPSDFKDNYTNFFFSDDFGKADFSGLIENIKRIPAIENLISKFFGDHFSFDSFLDLFCLYSNNLTIPLISAVFKEGIFGRLNNYLEKLEEGSLFAKKKSVLFKIVKIAAFNGKGFNENVFYKLDKQIKDHFNSIIFKYLTECLGRAKNFLKNAGGKGATYDFHNANKIIEIIRVISRYINPVLNKKEGRPELICDAILLLMKEMETLSVPADINSILMECSLVLNTLVEYFIYVKDFNAYVSERSKNKQLSLKQNNTSNKLDNFCIINEQDYNNLLPVNAPAPWIIETVMQRLYEYREDEQKNHPFFFKIVVMGDMRAGKTLLIRNLFDEKERFKFKVANGNTSTTHEVTSYTRTYTYNNTEKYIQITDTPGFEGIGREDLGHRAIDENFNDLFKGDDTVVLDIVLFRNGCIDWLSESHKDIISRVLEETKNKIIFLIPFTGLKKNAKKIKEKFLASLFYNLYVKGKELPLNEEKLKGNYKNFVERIIAIPINQLYSEENNESRFGLHEMGNAIIQCLSEEKKNDDNEFLKTFYLSLPGDKFCEEDNDIKNNIINSENDSSEEEKIDDFSEDDNNDFSRINNDNLRKEKLGSLKYFILESLIGFNNFKLKAELIDSKPLQQKIKNAEHLAEIDKKCPWYNNNKESYELLNYVYMLYLGSSSFINQFCKKSHNPLLYEIYKTEIYKLAELITSPYFFNYICLDNENLSYNIFFFKEEIELLNDQGIIQKILKSEEVLAQFCLVADDQFYINKDDYELIQGACDKFNENYTCEPKASEESAAKNNYNEIRKQLLSYFDGENNGIDARFLNFVICYDTTQRRYIIDRTNLRFLEIELKRDEKYKLYETIPESLKNYIECLNKVIEKFESYDDFQNAIKDKKNILYGRYHHGEEEELIRKRECKCIRVVFNAIQEENDNRGLIMNTIKSGFNVVNVVSGFFGSLFG